MAVKTSIQIQGSALSALGKMKDCNKYFQATSTHKAWIESTVVYPKCRTIRQIEEEGGEVSLRQ